MYEKEEVCDKIYKRVDNEYVNMCCITSKSVDCKREFKTGRELAEKFKKENYLAHIYNVF